MENRRLSVFADYEAVNESIVSVELRFHADFVDGRL